MCRLTDEQRRAVEARFFALTKPLPNGCRIWTGATTQGGPGVEKRPRGGPYGSFKVGRDADDTVHNSKRAHIVSAFLMGLIPSLKVPDGFQLDHTCESGTLCVTCLELVPSSENNKRRWTKAKGDQARVVVLEAARERRARAERAKRSRAQKARRRRTG